MTPLEQEFLKNFVLALVIASGVLIPFFYYSQKPKENQRFEPKAPASWVGQFPNRLDGFFVSFFVLIFSAPLFLPVGDTPEVTPGVLILSGLVFILLTTLIPALLFWRVNLIGFFGLRYREWPWLGIIAPAFVLGMLVVGVGVMVLTGWQAYVQEAFGGGPQAVVETLQNTPSVTLVILLSISAVIIAPIAEEVIFRGYLYPVLRGFSGIWPAALTTGLFFGLIHANVMGLPLLTLLGVALAILYERTKSIWVPIVCHACFNGFQIALGLLFKYGVFELPPELQ